MGSSENWGCSRPFDACLEPRAQSPGMGGARILEAQESRLFEQLTWQLAWQQGGPDKHVWLSGVSAVYLQATMVLLRPLVLLVALVVSDLHCLPWFINVSESQGPGTILQSFFFNCSSYIPTLKLLHVQPPTNFFNPPSLTRWQGIYVAKITLSSSAQLDALVVNHYELQLQFTCGNHTMEGPLSVDVQRDPGHIQCAGRFASPAGEIIQVPEMVTPGARLYTLLLPGMELQGAQMSITSAQDPPYFPGHFSINGQGWLQAPSQGLKGQAQKVFQLQILVNFGQGQSCHGMLIVKVLPAPSSQVSFLEQTQNITIPENLVPGSKVVQVQARGFDVRYEILSPMPCPLFSIGRGEWRRGWVPRCLCGCSRGDPYLLALVRNKLGTEAESWGPEVRNETWRSGQTLRFPPRMDRWEGGNRQELGARPNCASLALPPRPVDGLVRTTAPLELAQAPGAAVTRLQVKAFERLWPWASAKLELTVDVQSVNRWPPHCLPAMLVTQIPETTPVGTVLNTITCTDPDSPGSTLDYQLMFHRPPGTASLCLRDRVLQVNATLDCDTPGACFQYAASILVLDNGQPLMTTEVPVLVMVTPVNEFTPSCVPRTFRVREDARPHTLLGSVLGSDMDYPHDSIEFYISGGSAPFAVDRLSGEVRLLGPLDYELQKLYRLTVLLSDHSQDQDPTCHHSGSCTITIEVEDVNDHAPECEPPFQELTIHSHLGHSVEVTKVSCRVPQEPHRLVFSYSIVGGNSQSRFSLQGAVLVYNDLMLGLSWPEQPHTYELLIHVADAGPSTPHLSTTTTVIVHLVPWTASTVATSTHRATVSSMMTPLLVTDMEAFWQPESWFVVVLTVTSALLLLALGWLLSKLLQGVCQVTGSEMLRGSCLNHWQNPVLEWDRLAQVLQAPNKPAQALLLNSQGTEGPIEGFMEAQKMETTQAPSSVMSLHFDGRAQDSRESPSFQTILHLGPLSLRTPSQYLLLPPGIHYLLFT
uniref:Cadherin-related family member 4 isoform X5 n=1 Tax=Camelus bactrianus TaxID=9837 RepID=A0A9W3H7Z3_CAMBA|nr:cadherin-related family member 4 isoform X5 [Camelus bactrianus]